MAWKPKFPIKRGQKVIFLIFGHVDLSRSPRYYGCLHTSKRGLGCPKHNPKVLHVNLFFFIIIFFHLSHTLIFSKSLENRSTMPTQMESSGPKVL